METDVVGDEADPDVEADVLAPRDGEPEVVVEQAANTAAPTASSNVSL
ncbi:hypothetical protein PP563_25400 [Mycobacteroides abscessus]|nr:hypothetical protein [Mycobacteroides abscessus]MDM2386844.1 hypothetical protein [Mycobacteroides abscessus]MDM2392054.1 hypothetical protein [Mycobacteroides abscessus]